MKKKIIGILVMTLLIANIPPLSIKSTATTSLSGDLTVTAAEPIQVIVDEDYLVTNKVTVVRVTVHSTFPDTVETDVRVTYDFGREEGGETGPGLGVTLPIENGDNIIYVPGGPAIPGHPTAWATGAYGFKWTSAGQDDQVKVEVDHSNNVIEENENNNEWTPTQKWTFYDNGWDWDDDGTYAETMDVLWIPIYFPGDSYWSFNDISIAKWRHESFMLGCYPIAEDNIRFLKLIDTFLMSVSPSSGLISETWLYNHVVIPWVNTATTIYNVDRILIVLKRDWADYGVLGQAIGMLKNPTIQVPIVIHFQGVCSQADVDLVAHEMGHTFWLWHPHDIGQPVYDATRNWIQKHDYDTNARTLMCYDWKVPAGVPSDTAWIDEGRYCTDSKIKIDLTQDYPDLDVDWVWEWNLFDQMTKPQGSSKSSEMSYPRPSEWLRISGLCVVDGGASIGETIRYTDEEPLLQPESPDANQISYKIVLLDGDQQVLSETDFPMSFSYLIDKDFVGLEPEETDIMPFAIDVSWSEGTRIIQIRDPATEEVLDEKTVTQNPPTAEITFPNGGETLEVGNEYTITWESSDVDQDNLSYSIGISKDSAETWVPLTQWIVENEYVLDTTNLEPGNEYMVKIVASDGVNTYEDASDGTFSISIDNLPPYAPEITGPPSGRIGTEYEYKISADDPDNDSLSYYIDWGDNTNTGWFGPFPPGFLQTKSHTWNTEGTYTIKGKAKDIYGAESDWSDPLSVSMPKSKPYFNPLFLQFLENHPVIYQLLQRLLKL